VARPTQAQLEQWLATAAKGEQAPANEITREGFIGLAAEVIALRARELSLERKYVKALAYSHGLVAVFGDEPHEKSWCPR